MLTSIRGITAATLLAGTALVATPAFAADEGNAALTGAITLDRAALEVDTAEASNAEAGSGFTVSGNVALASEYRFRGVGLSNGDPALQGGIDVGHSSGFYAGLWGSSLDAGAAYGDLELDVYAGWSGDVAEGINLDVGVLYYLYPSNPGAFDPVDYIETYAKVGFTFGPLDTTVGVAYAPEQDSLVNPFTLDNGDNLYLFTDVGFGIPNTPFSLTGHLGYTDGVLSPDLLAGGTDNNGFDWSVGAEWAILENLSLGAMYTGVEGNKVADLTDDAFVVTLSSSW